MPSSKKYSYRSVEQEPPSLQKTKCQRWHEKWSLTILLSHILCLALWALSLAIVHQYAPFWTPGATELCGQLTYSPVQDAIEYEIRVFSQGKPQEHTEYWGPPDDRNNLLWRELWNVGGGQGIPREQAVRLPNRTSTLPPNWPELYYVDLDVFHQLHCLDHIRHAISNDTQYLHSSALLGEDHIYHCFEALRESLMCHVDVSALVLQWDPSLQKEKIHGDVAHTCRNFWKIHAWGKEHAIAPGWEADHDHGIN